MYIESADVWALFRYQNMSLLFSKGNLKGNFLDLKQFVEHSYVFLSLSGFLIWQTVCASLVGRNSSNRSDSPQLQQSGILKLTTHVDLT